MVEGISADLPNNNTIDLAKGGDENKMEWYLLLSYNKIIQSYDPSDKNMHNIFFLSCTQST